MKNKVKKAASAMLVLLMIMSLFPLSASAKKANEVAFLQAYEVDSERLIKSLCDNKSVIGRNSAEDGVYLHGAKSLPSAYSSVTAGYISTPKTQGIDGACWLFAGNSAAEASYAVNTGKIEDFSELQVAELFTGKTYDVLGYSTGDENICTVNPIDGGNSIYTIFTGASWRGLEREENCEYSVYKAQVFRNYGYKDPEALYGNDVAHLRNGWFVPYIPSEESMLDVYKTYISRFGAVDCGYYHDDKYYNPQNASYFSTAHTGRQNHEVSIVGWNDNYPKENFTVNCRPAWNGAWLVKNNWGTDWGTDGDSAPGNAAGGGYFWMSYYDTSIGNIIAFDYISADTYKYNYQYDGCAGLGSVSLEAGDSVCATYTVKGLTSDKERIDAVGIGLYDVGTTGRVSVYKGGTNGNPTSGSLVTTRTFSADMCGYHTVEIPNGPVLSAGENFTVVFTFDYDTEIFVDAACDAAWGYCKPDFSGERTYLVKQNNAIIPLNNMGITPRVKAYTNDAGNAPVGNHTVRFDAGEGVGAPVPQIKAKGNDMVLQFSIPRRNNSYEFVGWTKTEGSKNVDYRPGDVYSEDHDGDVTLYAVWNSLIPENTTVTPNRFDLVVGGEGQTVKVGFEPDEFVPILSVVGEVVEKKTVENGKQCWYVDGVRISLEAPDMLKISVAEKKKDSVIIYLSTEAEGTLYKITKYIYVNIKEPEAGDINCDGKVNAVDSAQMKRLITGVLSPIEDYMKTADINRDGKVNAVDSALMKRLILGM